MAAQRYLNFSFDFLDRCTTSGHFLDTGAHGSVYGPIPWRDMQLAIKQIKFGDGKVTDELKSKIEAKKEIWTSLEHRRLIQIHSVDLRRLPSEMFIVMEMAVGGSLNTTLTKLGSKNKLPIDVVTDWANQIAEGMLYLHENNIVHRDLKSSNSERIYEYNSY